MPTVIPNDGIFSSYRTTIIHVDSFSCILFLMQLIVFKLGCALFYQFYAKIIFDPSRG